MTVVFELGGVETAALPAVLTNQDDWIGIASGPNMHGAFVSVVQRPSDEEVPLAS